jgi:hypothetical protein
MPITKAKDIVQPKKRGVKRVTNRYALPSYTIADIFFGHLKGYSHAFNVKKQFTAFRAKKMWSLFDVESATKNSEAKMGGGAVVGEGGRMTKGITDPCWCTIASYSLIYQQVYCIYNPLCCLNRKEKMERILLISPVVTVSRNCQMMPEILASKIEF